MKQYRVHNGWRQALALTAISAALFAATAPSLAQPSLAQDSTAALPGDEVQLVGIDLPQPLDQVNADRYRSIFRAQAKSDFRGADALIGDLTDQSLLGHVLAARYLSPAYNSRPKELTDWLRAYSMLPDAGAMYDLAQAKGAKAASLTRPKQDITRVGSPDESVSDSDADWQAGLAAWRKKDFGTAATRFVKAAEKTKSSPWNRSAAAYWASRAFLRNKQPEQVSKWLKAANQYPRTFYGQLAQRALGIDANYNWNSPELTAELGQLLMTSGAGKRALALIQLGQLTAAEKELLILQDNARGDEMLSRALLAFSQAYRMPSLALRIGSSHRIKGGDYIDAAMYPVPSWKPKIGFSVDRALLYAIMRQESGFNPYAVSPAGAKGLMQLMPGTARIVSNNDAANLKDPLVSIAIGQKYIQRLMREGSVKDDLFMLAAAYNAGPGNLQKWKGSIGASANDDPLLFIESLPSHETRLFIERIMASYWIYQNRLGQETTSLDAVATGAWPTYNRQDKNQTASN